VIFTCVYAFAMGLCYAAFGAVVLETIGAGAAATKDNVLAGISNAPIAYQTVIDGWGHDRWGANFSTWRRYAESPLSGSMSSLRR